MAKESRSTETDINSTENTSTANQASQSDDRALINERLADQILTTVWSPVSTPKAKLRKQRQAALALVRDIKPADGKEGMLATQMVAAHEAAMACMRASIKSTNIAVAEFYMKSSAKFMAIYLQQVEALDKHRGKGQHHMTVKHVYVASGGQAVVGNVQAAGYSSAANDHSKTVRTQITQSAEQPFEFAEKARVPVEAKRTRVRKDGGDT